MPGNGLPPKISNFTQTELQSDPKRQAVPTLRGILYQAWCSIDAWLSLINVDDIIFLEGAEDFDIVQKNRATAVQVKNEQGSISLGNKKALTALENFWKLSCTEPDRKIKFHYLTTHTVAKENGVDFYGLCGLDAWRVARTNTDIALKLSLFLQEKLEANSSLRAFLKNGSPEEIQENLISRFEWLTNQPEINAVKQSAEDRLTVLLDSKNKPLTLIPIILNHLYTRFWEIILESQSSKRRLTLADLLRQIEKASTVNIPIQLDRVSELLGSSKPGYSLLTLLLGKLPELPEPLLHRKQLSCKLEELVLQRRVVLLTGTVHKGKTTIAQLVAWNLSSDAWWLNLTQRTPDQVDNLFLALANRVDQLDCPNLIVIDDLDLNHSAYRCYRDSLSMVLHRAGIRGTGVLITAQGSSCESPMASNILNLETLEIPAIDFSEIESLCLEYGCLKERARAWSAIISMRTKGHPKLVQVLIAEQCNNGWPAVRQDDFITESSVVLSERDVARRLLSESVSPDAAEFIYTLSETTISLDRQVTIQLIESIDRKMNAGDIIDSLTGKWIEQLDGQWYRTTSLLHGVAKNVWSKTKLKSAHIKIHDAILSKNTLNQEEAAALLFHAYIAKDPRRLSMDAMRLQMLGSHAAEQEVLKQLLWLPMIALEPGQSIINDPVAEASLRSLQFKAALLLDSDDAVLKVCDRWAEGIEKLDQSELRDHSEALMWLSIGMSDNAKIPLQRRLNATSKIATLNSRQHEIFSRINDDLVDSLQPQQEIPKDATINQAILLLCLRRIKSLAQLVELIEWLENCATDIIKREFDNMIEWPLVQSMGSFIHSAWAADAETVTDWDPWINTINRSYIYATKSNSSRFGRELAKAESILQTEYIGNSEKGIKALDKAESEYGNSIILMEQRANVLFHSQDNEAVINLWNKISDDSDGEVILDPFAYRRVAISAARLNRMTESKSLFLQAIDIIEPETFQVTKFALKIDAAYAASIGGNQTEAAILLGEAIADIPFEARSEKETHWNAVLRVAADVCTYIESKRWSHDVERRFDPGYASTPSLEAPDNELGQEARCELTQARVLKLRFSLGLEITESQAHIDTLLQSKYFMVRLIAAEAQLARIIGTPKHGGFIEALLVYDKSLNESAIYYQSNQNPILPDEDIDEQFNTNPERWSGMLYAALSCSGINLLQILDQWLLSCEENISSDSKLYINIKMLHEGANLPVAQLSNIFHDASNPAVVRCGAAARSLLEPINPDEALVLQAFLASATVSDGSQLLQSLFNQHIAKHFSRKWINYSQNPSILYVPNLSIPKLIQAVDALKKGAFSLRGFLESAELAANTRVASYLKRVK